MRAVWAVSALTVRYCQLSDRFGLLGLLNFVSESISIDLLWCTQLALSVFRRSVFRSRGHHRGSEPSHLVIRYLLRGDFELTTW